MRLDELRQTIDQIDQDMMDLFLKRMAVSKQIGDYKREKGLKVLDAKREKELLEKRREILDNDDLWPLYKKFLISVMDLSKDYQK